MASPEPTPRHVRAPASRKELDLTEKETVQQAIMCLQDVLQMDLKSKDLEVHRFCHQRCEFASGNAESASFASDRLKSLMTL